ncbi:cupin [Niveomyces insectorum RCEF 264]|uniref:Cupin n=1 Tax=Niveomyces insectorum RCEF 264 TaxID=1081102 RepID=A0A167MZW8_9HYPO|nr:cupin [Niveomyces insectorum RCEF 264]
MAALLPLIHELLPMLMPGPVHIAKAADIRGPEEEAVAETEPEAVSETEPKTTDGPATRHEDGQQTTRGVPGTDPAQWSQPSPPPPPPPPPPPAPPAYPRGGVSLRDAIVHKTSSLCASVLTVKPQCATVVFHNGEQEAIVYAVSGTAVLATLPDDADEHDEDDDVAYDDDDDNTDRTSSKPPPPPPTTHTLGPGDFAFVPAWTEHQVRNESADTDVVWVVVRNAGAPTVVPLTSWGGDRQS